MEHVLLTGCGNATEASVEVDNSTTWVWDQCRISGVDATSTLGGLRIDRTAQFTVGNGNIESCNGPAIKLGSKAEATTPVDTGTIRDLDIENIGDNVGAYIEMGYGWTGAAFNGVLSIQVENVHGLAAGSTDVRYGVKIDDAVDISFINCSWGLAGGSIAAYHYIESNVIGVYISTNRRSFASTAPWVSQAGTGLSSATPQRPWNQAEAETFNASATKSGATPDIRVDTVQGGLYRHISLSNGGATSVTKLLFSGNATGAIIYVSSPNANTTLVHAGAGGAQGELRLIGAKDLLMVANRPYIFKCDGTLWLQVAGFAEEPQPLGSTTSVGTDADVLEKTLATFTIPANVFDENLSTQAVLWATLPVAGTFGTIRVKIDGVTVATGLNTSIAVAGVVNIRMNIMRSSTTLVVGMYEMVNGAAAGSVIVVGGGYTATVDVTAAITITITGQNAAANANDVVFNRGGVVFYGSPAAAFVG
jgi:hypothetical protein